MTFPKNIMQIGTVEEGLKIYIEDYAHTYIKQIESNISRNSTTMVLYGKEEWDQECHYLFVYGAVKETQNDVRTQKECFREHQPVGKLEVGNQENKIYLKHDIMVCLKGYYVFYEQNPAMQSFLVNMNRRSELIEDREKYMSTSKMKTRNESRVQKEKMEKRKKKRNFPEFSIGYVGTCMVVVLAAVTLAISLRGQAQFGEFVTSMARAIVFEEEAVVEEDSVIIIEESVDEKLQEERETIQENDQVQEEMGGEEIEKQVIETESNISETYQEDEEIEQEEIEQEEIELEGIEQEEIEQEEISESVQVEMETYTIREGDTLESVCAVKYQDTARVWEVCELNGIEDADKIIQGQVILLP